MDIPILLELLRRDRKLEEVNSDGYEVPIDRTEVIRWEDSHLSQLFQRFSGAVADQFQRTTILRYPPTPVE